jgi:hypothetical protein
MEIKNMEKENKLQVQQYDASEVEAKKKKILKIVATGVGTVALTTMLGCYGLRGGKSAPTNEHVDTIPMTVKQDSDTIDIGTIVLPMGTFILGGGGAWFNSVIEFLEA